MAVDGVGMGRVGRQYSTFLSDFVVRIANTRFFSAPLSWRGDARAPPIATTQDSSAVLGARPRNARGIEPLRARMRRRPRSPILPARWYGRTAAGGLRIRQDHSRKPVRGAEGTASPLSRNCFAGQRRGWGVWETSGWPWGGTALSAGSASHAGSLRASPRALFLFEGWASSPSKLQRVADAQSPRRWNDGWIASGFKPWQPRPDVSAS